MTSEVEYIKLKVDGLLDLDMLANEYHIPKHTLIDFHNKHCEISEILPLFLPKYVPFVYLPKSNFESRNTLLIPNSTLTYPVGKSEKNYGVVIKYLHSDVQMHFEVHIKKENNIVEINKKKTFVNNKEIENLIEKLYETSQQAIYPLRVAMRSNGSFSEIVNQEEISERWRNSYLPKLKEYYVSPTAEEILSRMNEIFKNINQNKDFFYQSVFYKLFFHPVYQSYSGFTKSGHLQFYFANIQRYISYEIDYYLNREYTRGTKIALQIKGNETGNIPTDDQNKGKIDFLYKFRKDTNELFSITGSASTFDNGKELKIEFQLFEI